MTNNDIYNAVCVYSTLRSKSGCSKDKKYWTRELRILRHVVDHEIIMNRDDYGQGKDDRPELKAAYDNLRTGLETAMQFVHGTLK